MNMKTNNWEVDMTLSKKGKAGLAVLVAICLLATAGATYLTFFNEVETTLNVEQSIKLDGMDYDTPITHNIDEATGGCCYCFEHTITNDGCNGIDLDFIEWGEPDLDGINIYYYDIIEGNDGGDCCNHILDTLEVDVLDGVAETNDDFEVYVDGVLVFTYLAVGGTETWITHVIDLTPFQFVCCGTHTVDIVCTAPAPWSYFNPYGQLAVDVISLYCEDGVLCDTVDIGEPTSEAGHNLRGWGPIQPMTSGGGYGGITDCRCTWFYTDGDIVPPEEPPYLTADGPGASVDLTCEECYDPPVDPGCPECGEGTPVPFPIHLEQDESYTFCICYGLDMLIKPGTYIIHHELIPIV